MSVMAAKKGTTTRPANAGRDTVISEIARLKLHIETLEARGRDCLDFHDVGVLTLEAALVAAYEAGRRSRSVRVKVPR